MFKKEEKKYLFHLGFKLRKIRQDRDWSLEYIEEKGFPSAQFLRRIETGQQNPTILTLRRLAKAYKIPLNDFFKD